MKVSERVRRASKAMKREEQEREEERERGREREMGGEREERERGGSERDKWYIVYVNMS